MNTSHTRIKHLLKYANVAFRSRTHTHTHTGSRMMNISLLLPLPVSIGNTNHFRSFLFQPLARAFLSTLSFTARAEFTRDDECVCTDCVCVFCSVAVVTVAVHISKLLEKLHCLKRAELLSSCGKSSGVSSFTTCS